MCEKERARAPFAEQPWPCEKKESELLEKERAGVSENRSIRERESQGAVRRAAVAP